MADNYVRLQGQATNLQDNQVAPAIEAGAAPISKEEAQQSAGAQQDLSYVDQNWGLPGQAGLGALSGLTLGLAPGVMAQLGLVDPGHVRAAQTGLAYQGGDIAGMVIPSLLSGGEGALARAASYTPMGLAERAGASVAERLLGTGLEEGSGLLGRMAMAPARMAARGATEAALISMGHETGESLLDNRPLSAQSLAATGMDGALFGGLIGGSLGTVGALGEEAMSGMKRFATSAGSKRLGLGVIGRRLGEDAADVESAGAGKYSDRLKMQGKILEEGGAKLSDSTTKMVNTVEKQQAVYRAARNDVIQELESSHLDSISAPNMNRLKERLDAAVVAPRIGDPGGEAMARKAVDDFWSGFAPTKEIPGTSVTKGTGKFVRDGEALGFNHYSNVVKEDVGDLAEAPKKRIGKFEGVDSYFTPVKFDPVAETAGKAERVASDGSWEGIIKSRDRYASELSRDSSVTSSIRKEILSNLDSELTKVMEGTSPELADKFRAATSKLQMSEEMVANLGKKGAQELIRAESSVTPRDWASAGISGAFGHPVIGATLLAAKSVGRQLQGRLEPALAQYAYDSMIGAKATAATSKVKSKVAQAIGSAFKVATKTPMKAAYLSNAERQANRQKGPTRAEYESTATRVEQLISEQHQERVRRYAEQLSRSGYPDMAKEVLDANQRASQYLMYNMPPRQGAKAAGSLRPMPVSKTLNMDEFKFLRQAKGVLDVFGVLEDIEKGTVSRESIQALKYTSPAIHQEMVAQATQQVAEMKAEGKFLPMSKITTLGLALDAPIDSTLTPDYVNACQMALNMPPQEPGQQKPQQGPDGPPIGQGMGQAFMTPIDKMQMVQG